MVHVRIRTCIAGLTGRSRMCHGQVVNGHHLPRRWLIGYFLVRAVVFTVLGLLMLLQPGDTVRTLARLIGWVLLVLASVDVVAASFGGAGRAIRLLVLARGLLTAVLGVVLVLLTDATITVVAIVAGMQLAVGGGVSILLGVWSREELVAWGGVVLRGVITVLIGAALIAWPEKTVVVVAVMLGAQWMLSGFVSTAVAVAIGTRRSGTAG